MQKAFISSDHDHPLRCARLPAGLFHSRFLRKEKFPIKEQRLWHFCHSLNQLVLSNPNRPSCGNSIGVIDVRIQRQDCLEFYAMSCCDAGKSIPSHYNILADGQ